MRSTPFFKFFILFFSLLLFFNCKNEKKDTSNDKIEVSFKKEGIFIELTKRGQNIMEEDANKTPEAAPEAEAEATTESAETAPEAPAEPAADEPNEASDDADKESSDAEEKPAEDAE